MKSKLRTLLKIWTLPNTLLGLLIGAISMGFGAKVQIRRGCFEFYGGPLQKILNRIPPGSHTSAMTLGHTILGQSTRLLDRARDHEHIHVRQYELWGPLFLPAYLGCSCWLWLRKRDPYLDNPFEIEAYAVSDPRKPASDDKGI